LSASDDWPEHVRALLEANYLAGDNPRAQSGFGGDEEYWRVARGVIAEAVDRSGSFLDVGCANGHLLECLFAWCASQGHTIEPFGVDILPAMVELARSRLPQWHDRLFVGDARTWKPPRQFDFVRTELVYAPDDGHAELVAHLLDAVVAPGGRLIVCSYGSRTRPEPRAEDLAGVLEAWGHVVAGTRTAVVGERVTTWVGWIDLSPVSSRARSGDPARRRPRSGSIRLPAQCWPSTSSRAPSSRTSGPRWESSGRRRRCPCWCPTPR